MNQLLAIVKHVSNVPSASTNQHEKMVIHCMIKAGCERYWAAAAAGCSTSAVTGILMTKPANFGVFVGWRKVPS